MTWRGAVSGLACAALLSVLAACGGSGEEDTSRPVLHWYVGPERADVAGLAEACTREADGAYRIEVVDLPDDLDTRHSTLVRRLVAEDASIDLLSVDTAFLPELAAAQLLAPIPEDRKLPYAQDVFPTALAASSVDGQLVAAPWWFDPHLLWYRGSAAERAGLDTTKPILWDDLLAGAERTGRTVAIDDLDGEGLTGWVNALVAAGGGTLLDGTGRRPDVGLATPAGRTAAGVVEYFAEAGVGPGPRADAVEELASRGGGFLLAPASVVSDPAIADVASDLAWTAYPSVGSESIAPLNGASLAVPLYAPRSELSFDAIDCLTSAPLLEQLMIGSGHAAARSTTFDAESVVAGYPMAEVVRSALENGVALPATPYWQRARAALLDTWLPVEDVSVATTPETSQSVVRRLVGGGLR